MSAKPLLSPGWYAAGSFLVCPVAVLFMLFTAVLFTVLWPIIPFIAYSERRDQMNKQAEAEATP
jgi:hypothetical protein